MRWLLIGIAVAIACCGCSNDVNPKDKKSPWIDKTPWTECGFNTRVKTAKYNGHEYIMMVRSAQGCAIVHSASCDCTER